MTNLETLETWLRRVWAEEDLTAISEMLVSDTRAHGLVEHTQVGPDAFRPFAEAILGLLSDMRLTVDKFIEDGDWASALVSVSATARATGAPVVFTGQIMARYGDGKILEGFNNFDFITMFEQLGLMPEASMSRCLGGVGLTPDAA